MHDMPFAVLLLARAMTGRMNRRSLPRLPAASALPAPRRPQES
jgi:hypothetical protein